MEEDPNYFTLVCSTKPHLLVYVQESAEDGSRSWPAKVLLVNDNDTVTIECFGDHLREEYNFDQCELYSDTNKDLRKKMENAIKSKSRVNAITKKEEFVRAFKVIKID